ncbi:MAG: VOC family protein [Xanthobacteraceae bacterium]
MASETAGKETPPFDVKRLATIGFTVSDMERSIAFYSEVLGFEKVADFPATGPAYDRLAGVFGVNMRIVHLRLGEQVIELTRYRSPPQGRPIPLPSYCHDRSFQHIAIVVSDMDKAFEILQSHDVRQISPEPQTIPPSNVPAAGIRAFKFRDPDHHNLELIWFPPDKGDPYWQRPGERLFLGIDHTAITVGDTETSLEFYRDLLGMETMGGSINVGSTQEYLDNVLGVRVRITSVSPAVKPPSVEFLHYEAPSGGRPMPADTRADDIWHWEMSFVVSDVKAAASFLRAGGVRFVTPEVVAIDHPSLGFSKAIMVLDPDGHAVRLVEP